MTVSDGNGNSATCNVTLTGDDTTDPLITVCPGDRAVVLDGSCGLVVPDMTGEVTASDNCTAAGSLTITQVPAAGAVLPSGEGTTHVVVMTVSDGNGNSATCNVTLTGDDTTDPLITVCPGDRAVVLDGSCGLVVPDMTGEVTASDNCTASGSLTITQVPAAGAVLPSGEGTTHVVVMTVSDGNGNSATCNVTLTGDDTTDPLITVCPGDRAVVLDGSCGLVVPDMTGEVTASDNCTAAGSLTITQVPAAGAVLPSGEGTTHVVVMTVSDGNGNSATCNVTLTGDDTTDPLITVCPGDRAVVLDGSCGLVVPDMTGEVTASDNCTASGSLTITQVPAAGAVLPSGEGTTHVVVMTVSDGNGNSATCNVTLTGDDTTDPLITVCPVDRAVVLDGSCGLVVPDMTGEVTASDNCTAAGSLTITQVPAAGAVLPSGEGTTHVVVMTVSDGNGNSATCNVTLTGDDTTDPLITVCPVDRAVVLDGSCGLVVPDMTGEVTASDNCTATGSLTITQVPAAGAVLPSGEGTAHVVVMTVSDGNGNSATCNVTLTGDDTTDPLITVCPVDRAVVLDGSCGLAVPDMTGEVTASDNCTASGSLTITQVPAAGAVLPSGEGTTHVVVMTVSMTATATVPPAM